MWRWIAAGLVTLMTLAMIGGVAAFAIIQHYGSDLPTLEKLQHYEPPIATRLYAGNGNLLAEYATEKRIFVPLEAMPKQLIQAFVAAEDKKFYEHPGIDFIGIVRAAINNVDNIMNNRSLEGASTITQQVVKNFLLTKEQSLERKIKEALLAFRITKAMSKDQVLELYLNDIYLGIGSYGVASAALNYFNKSLDELTLEEAAFLAALPKGPANYDPRYHYERAKVRRDWVIERMAEDGYIETAEAEKAKAGSITMRSRDETEFAVAAFFAEEVRRILVEQYGSDVLYKGGLTVHTTVDPELQKLARDALRKGLLEYDRRHGFRGAMANVDTDGWLEKLQQWSKTHSPVLIENEQLAVVLQLSDTTAKVGLLNGLDGTLPLEEMKWAKTNLSHPQDILKQGDVIIVAPVKDKEDTYALRQEPEVNGAMMVIDPHTGRVLAMVGGYSYENTEFNRATQAERQPGSAFKPFVYLAALEAGYTPSTIIRDEPIAINQGPGLPLWTPKNYGGDFLGPTTMRRGLETSRNVMTVRLALQVGIKRIVEVAERFGVYGNLRPLFSVVLGSSETTLDRLVNAYAMLVNGGKRVQPALIERIQNRKGETIYRRDTRECTGCKETESQFLVTDYPPIPLDNREQVVDPRTAYQMVSMMEGVVQRGTAVRARVLGRPVAGKTGTTNDSRDAWFVGYTPDLVAGVYVGFDSPKKLGSRETGGGVALPSFIAFMQEALKDKPATPFRIPEGIRLVKTDITTGRQPTAASQAKNIIFEAFKQGDVPGSMPVLDVSTPLIEGPLPVGEEGETTGNGGLPSATSPTPDSSTPPPVWGTGGLY